MNVTHISIGSARNYHVNRPSFAPGNISRTQQQTGREIARGEGESASHIGGRHAVTNVTNKIWPATKRQHSQKRDRPRGRGCIEVSWALAPSHHMRSMNVTDKKKLRCMPTPPPAVRTPGPPNTEKYARATRSWLNSPDCLGPSPILCRSPRR